MKSLRIVGFLLIMLGCIALIITAKEPLDVYQERPMPPLELTGLDGEEVTTGRWALETQGPKVINLFASWCTPCIKELPELEKLNDYVPVYGIAWRDDPAKLSKWLEKHGNPYREVGIDKGLTFMFDLGIDGVPTTLLLDETQKIVYIHKGLVTQQHIETEFLPRLRLLEQEG